MSGVIARLALTVVVDTALLKVLDPVKILKTRTGIRLLGGIRTIALLTLDMFRGLATTIDMLRSGIVRRGIKKVLVVVNTIKLGLPLTNALDAPELRERATLVQNVLGCARHLIQILLVRLVGMVALLLVTESVNRIHLKLNQDILALIMDRNALTLVRLDILMV